MKRTVFPFFAPVAGAAAGTVRIAVGALDSFAAAGNTDTNHPASLASAMFCKIRKR